MRKNDAKTRAVRHYLVLLLALLIGPTATTYGLADTVSSTDDTGLVWWNELVSANPENSREFYAGVIGWTPKIVAAEDSARSAKPGEEEYTYFMQNAVESAGLAKFESDEPSAPKPGWLTYIQVSNVDDAVAEAIRRGGKVLKAPYTSKNTGRLAVIQDPEGNAVGLFAKISNTTTP